MSISDKDRAAVSQSVKHAKLIDASRKLARIVKHVDPEPKIKAQRTRLEKSLTKWMKHHGGEAFDRPFSDDHKKVIAKIETAINDGGLFALAMARGAGKSTILKWAMLYCILTGRRKFVVVVAATGELAQSLVEFARQQISESDTLHAHYPHVTTYARATDGKAIKAKFQLRADGKTSGILWSKTTLVLPEVMAPDGSSYTSNGAILEGHGLTGAIRGKWKDTKSGKVLRPDFALIDDPQTREALSVDTPIPTANGWKAMGEICIGDVVFDEAGRKCNVVAVSDVSLNRDCCKVVFDEGSEVVCDVGHLWTTQTALQRTNKRRRKYIEQRKFGKPFDRKPLYSTVTTGEIIATLKGEADRNNHSIDMPGPVEGSGWPLQTPPYTLGAWLGDGDSGSSRITGEDEEVFQRIEKDGFTLGKVSAKPNNKAYTRTIKGLCKTLRADGIMPERYWNERPSAKKAPHECLLADKDSRMELLRGMMDTDGWCSKRDGCCGFGNCNEHMIDFIVSLLASLGIKSRKKSVKRVDRMAQDAWQVDFYTTQRVFNLERKFSRLPKKNKPNVRRRYIQDVIPCESTPVRCIKVDSPSALYLCGKQFIPTHNSAESDSQCAMRERIITGDVLGLAGPRKRIAAVMPCTIIRQGDLAARFLDHDVHPEWNGITTGLVKKWPDAQDTLWDDYAKIYKADGVKKATEFYKKNRKAMDKGGEISWPHRVRDGELSAMQTAQNLLLEAGDQFWAEYQNDPKDPMGELAPYTLTPAIIESRVDRERKAFDVPSWVTRIYASSDINPSYAFSTVVIGFGEDQTAAILWHGIHKLAISSELNKPAYDKAIFEALSDHAKEIAGIPCKVEAYAADAGGSNFDAAIRFCMESANLTGIPAYGFTGRGFKQYTTNGKTVVKGQIREQCHGAMDRKQGRIIRWVPWNADYWKEVVQRAFLSEVGSPAGASLYYGNHTEYAMQMCGEKLVDKGELGGMIHWDFRRVPGRTDFLDATAQCYALAAYHGIGTGGAVDVRRKRKRYTQADFQRR